MSCCIIFFVFVFIVFYSSCYFHIFIFFIVFLFPCFIYHVSFIVLSYFYRYVVFIVVFYFYYYFYYYYYLFVFCFFCFFQAQHEAQRAKHNCQAQQRSLATKPNSQAGHEAQRPAGSGLLFSSLLAWSVQARKTLLFFVPHASLLPSSRERDPRRANQLQLSRLRGAHLATALSPALGLLLFAFTWLA